MRRDHRRWNIALVTLLLAGCGAPAPAPQPAPGPASTFGGTDRAWIEITLAMHEQVVPLLDAVPARAGAAATRDLAARVRVFTEAELPQLRALHTLAGLPPENPHLGMPMPGMVTGTDLTTLTALTGPDFDAAATAKIEETVEQAVMLARSEQENGTDPRTRALAAEVLAARSAVGSR
ncbi:DUF305 domain-containing protein [Actinoplanes sp. CA-252034]|uniref:DUF305 domain-containing protein n=1 Tax=Actinoplanes sp. CA-252034 TaxID=3239906 RepID=UPI003D99DBF4